jgi:CRISPR/Cas system-associated endonuclease Cas1
MQDMLEHGIEFALFTFSGRLLGQLTPPQAQNIARRIAQFQQHGDPNFACVWLKPLFATKLVSLIQMISAR